MHAPHVRSKAQIPFDDGLWFTSSEIVLQLRDFIKASGGDPDVVTLQFTPASQLSEELIIIKTVQKDTATQNRVPLPQRQHYRPQKVGALWSYITSVPDVRHSCVSSRFE